MASRGQKKPSLRDLSKGYVDLSDPEHQSELLEGTDRAAALVGCAILDSALVNVLSTQFVYSDGNWLDILFHNLDAALPSFSSRIKLGRALGIYDAEFAKHLDTIRQIRNAFAHAGPPLLFTNPLISKACAKLPGVKINEETEHTLGPERERYVVMCHIMVGMLDYVARSSGNKPVHIWINNGQLTPPATFQEAQPSVSAE